MLFARILILFWLFLVIDYHLDWCGPCEVIEPNFRSIYFLMDNAANKIEFLTVSILNKTRVFQAKSVKNKFWKGTKTLKRFSFYKFHLIHTYFERHDILYLTNVDNLTTSIPKFVTHQILLKIGFWKRITSCHCRENEIRSSTKVLRLERRKMLEGSGWSFDQRDWEANLNCLSTRGRLSFVI